mmetsp:Transcript_24261/g.51972  ORF Transcript_24261/g.51972 Transcript_24261/m.51972 type:complete len:334 (+) Transcript_24261:131-1132(+)
MLSISMTSINAIDVPMTHVANCRTRQIRPTPGSDLRAPRSRSPSSFIRSAASGHCSAFVALKSRPLCPIAGLPCCLSHSSSTFPSSHSAHRITALLRWLSSHFLSVAMHENGTAWPSGTKMESHPNPLPSTGSTMAPVHRPVKSTGSACGYGQKARVHTAVALLSSYPIRILYRPSQPSLSWNHFMNGPGIPPNAWNSRLVSSTTHAPPASWAPCIALFFATASVLISCISGRSTSSIRKLTKLSSSSEDEVLPAYFDSIMLISLCFIAFPVTNATFSLLSESSPSPPTDPSSRNSFALALHDPAPDPSSLRAPSEAAANAGGVVRRVRRRRS